MIEVHRWPALAVLLAAASALAADPPVSGGREGAQTNVILVHGAFADGLARRTARFRQSPVEAAKILTPGEARPDPKLDPIELASYAVTANILRTR